MSNQRRNISNYTLLKMIDVQIILLVSLVRWVTQKKLLMLSLMSQMMIAKLMRMRAHYPNAKIHYSVNIFFLWDVFFFQKHPKPLWIFPSFFTMLLNGKMSSSEKTTKKALQFDQLYGDNMQVVPRLLLSAFKCFQLWTRACLVNPSTIMNNGLQRCKWTSTNDLAISKTFLQGKYNIRQILFLFTLSLHNIETFLWYVLFLFIV